MIYTLFFLGLLVVLLYWLSTLSVCPGCISGNDYNGKPSDDKKVTNSLPDKIYLVDSNFKEASASKYVSSELIPFQWTRINNPAQIPEGSLVVYTDHHLKEALKQHVNVAWILEPGVIDSNPYGEVTDHDLRKLYRKILNFDHTFLRGLADQGFWVPNAMTWIPPKIAPAGKKEHKVTFIASSKKRSLGHQIRHDIVKQFSRDLEIHGSIVGKPFSEKSEILFPSRFHVEVENCKREGYFSEKLIDALRSECIVLYWGDEKVVSQIFNMKTIWCWNTIKELDQLMIKAYSMSEEEYEAHKPEIKENANIAYDYICPENFLVEPLTRVWKEEKKSLNPK